MKIMKNSIKKFLIISISLSVIYSATVVYAVTILQPVGGGSGWGFPGGIKSGFILFGNGLSPFATSTGLYFTPSLNRLTTTYASTTALSATSLCLTGENCITSWPTSGGTFSWTPAITYNENTNSTTTPIWFKDTLYATSTSFFTGLATFGNASTSVLSAEVICLTGDTCETSWPIGGGSGTGWASSTDPTSIYFTGSSNVSIGTTTPYSKLSVWGSGTGATSMFELTNSASTSLMTVLNNGNVGIGTTSPYAKLSVVGQTVAAYFTATTTSINTFPNLTATNATTTSFGINSETFTDLTGTGLQNTGGALTLDPTGAWAGTLTRFGTDFYTYFHATTTDFLTQGSTNKYYADALVNAYIHASTTIAKTYTANTFSNLNIFGNASTTMFSSYGPSYFGATATSSFNSAGVLTLISPLAVSNGGTGVATFGQGWLHSTGGTANLTSSTSPTVNYITATSTTLASYFPYASTTALTVSGTLYPALLGGAIDAGGATSFEIPNAAAPTVDASGEMAIDTTSGQLKIYNGAVQVYKPERFVVFGYATSTAWTGTTTMLLAPAYIGETWTGVKCETDAGTLNVSIYDGTNRMDMFNASTTIGSVGLSTNNTFTANESRRVDFGTPATSPTKISCKAAYNITAD